MPTPLRREPTPPGPAGSRRPAQACGPGPLLADVVRALADTLARRPHAARGPAVDSPFACAFCGQARARELFAEAVREAQGYHVVRCERCGLVATHPRAAREAIPAFYGGQYYGPENAKFGPLTEGFVFLFRVARLRALRLMGIRRGAILDLGCGNGLFLRVVERAGYSAWGTELSDAAAAAARRLFGARIRTGPLADCGFAAGQFDAVTAWHVFEHLPDPRSTLRECHRILRPGGGLLLAVPNIESCQARWAGASWFHLDLPRHLFHYGPATLTAMLEAEGFRVERMSHYSLEQNPFALLQSALHRLGRPHHGLYALLRGPLDRTRRLRLRRLPAYTAYLASFPAAAAATYLGSWLGSGATISVLARRVEAPPGPVT